MKLESSFILPWMPGLAGFWRLIYLSYFSPRAWFSHRIGALTPVEKIAIIGHHQPRGMTNPWNHDLNLRKEPQQIQQKTYSYIDSASSGFPIGKITNHIQQNQGRKEFASGFPIAIKTKIWHRKFQVNIPNFVLVISPVASWTSPWEGFHHLSSEPLWNQAAVLWAVSMFSIWALCFESAWQLNVTDRDRVAKTALWKKCHLWVFHCRACFFVGSTRKDMHFPQNPRNLQLLRRVSTLKIAVTEHPR
jgi:hypothetical protein